MKPGGCSDAPRAHHPDCRPLPAGFFKDKKKNIWSPAVTVTWMDWLLEKGEPDSNWYDFAKKTPGLDDVVVPDKRFGTLHRPCLVFLAICIRSLDNDVPHPVFPVIKRASPPGAGYPTRVGQGRSDFWASESVHTRLSERI